jgi:hypothetical protein
MNYLLPAHRSGFMVLPAVVALGATLAASATAAGLQQVWYTQLLDDARAREASVLSAWSCIATALRYKRSAEVFIAPYSVYSTQGEVCRITSSEDLLIVQGLGGGVAVEMRHNLETGHVHYESVLENE